MSKAKLIVSKETIPGTKGYQPVLLNGVQIGFIGNEEDGQPFFLLHSQCAMRSEAEVYTTVTRRLVKHSTCVTLKKGIGK